MMTLHRMFKNEIKDITKLIPMKTRHLQFYRNLVNAIHCGMTYDFIHWDKDYELD